MSRSACGWSTQHGRNTEAAGINAILKDQALYDEVQVLGARADADLGVHATPTLFVNGRRHEGAPPTNALDEIVRLALAS